MQEVKEMTFYDSVTGKPLFIAPRGRSMEAFVAESKSHGWPSFRDEEVCVLICLHFAIFFFVNTTITKIITKDM